MNIVDRIGKKQMEKVLAQRSIPEFGAGDTVRVDVKVVEGSRERIQAFEGVCIARKNDGVNSSFTVTIGICSLAKPAACAVPRQMRLIEARIWFRTASV